MKQIKARELWTCPQCRRQFERQGQSHSCRPFALEQHFINRATSERLYKKLIQDLENQIDSFKIESLECCIHLVSGFTFGAVRIIKNKIRVEFTLSDNIQHDRFYRCVQMSAHRYLYLVDVKTEADIDPELIQWIKDAQDKK